MSQPALPLVSNIRRFALDDGPGIRTTVFLKGCPLACVWCHNPESLDTKGEIAFYPQSCIRCGDCVAACPAGALTDGPTLPDRTLCPACGKCADACPSKALKKVGEYYSVNDLIDLLMRDRIFYETSGGGVTFSGGEPTLHMDYLGAALAALKALGIHTAIQTCGMFDPAGFREKVLPHLDLIFYDIKLMDGRRHAEFTGKDNGVILENLARLVREVPNKVRPRVPLVPGITADEENLGQVARFLKGLGCTDCEPLPYNPAGLAKRAALGHGIPPGVSFSMMPAEEESRWKRLLVEEFTQVEHGL